MIAAITNHLWQSTMFVLAAGVIAFALRKNGAHIRHRVWVIASLKFLVPFSVLMSLGSALPALAPSPNVATSALDAPALSVTVDRFARPFTDDVFFAPSTTAERAETNWTAIILVGTWASGFAAVALMRLRGWRRIRAAVRASAPLATVGRRGRLEPSLEGRAKARPYDGLEVRSAPGLLEPGVVGLWRPVLLVPAGIEQQLTTSQLDAVLTHELCHVRRRDNLTSAIHMVVEAAFWFHPLVWFVGARLVEERERACDEHVLRAGGEPHIYAEGILNVCKLYVESPLTCVSGVTGADLKRRIEAIMFNRIGVQLSLSRRLALMGAAVAAVVLPLLAGVAIAPLGASAQQTAAAIKAYHFDVVSIKLCPGLDTPMRGAGRGAGPLLAQTTPGHVQWDCVSLAELVDQAFVGQDNPLLNMLDAPTVPIEATDGVKRRVRGGPSWVTTERYAIEATGSIETINPAVGQRNLRYLPPPMREALRAMLVERFQLKTRRETEQQDIYALVVAPGGLKITPDAQDSCTVWAPGMPRGGSALVNAKPICGNIHQGMPLAKLAQLRAGADLATVMALPGPDQSIEFTHVRFEEMAKSLSNLMDRFVLDKTGQAGMFTLAVEFTRDEHTRGSGLTRGPEPQPSTSRSGPSIFKAFEAFGLRIETTKGPAEYLVIDSAQKPQPN